MFCCLNLLLNLCMPTTVHKLRQFLNLQKTGHMLCMRKEWNLSVFHECGLGNTNAYTYLLNSCVFLCSNLEVPKALETICNQYWTLCISAGHGQKFMSTFMSLQFCVIQKNKPDCYQWENITRIMFLYLPYFSLLSDLSVQWNGT